MILQHYPTSQFETTSLEFSGATTTRCPTKTEKNVRVLVVEDELINQYVAKSFLESSGYQVDIAATGQAALHFYQVNQYAVILMDVDLPDIKGTEVTRQIRKLEETTGKHTPIITLTANGPSVKPECLAAGMDDFSTKPFEMETLNQLIKVWIKKSK